MPKNFVLQDSLKVRGSCAMLAVALVFKIQDTACIFQKPGSWKQGIFFVFLPPTLLSYISVSCKENAKSTKASRKAQKCKYK